MRTLSFLSQLYRYRQSEQRGPLEDFLTEALAEWLRQATSAGALRRVLSGLFKLETVASLPDANLNVMRWETQHIIGPGYGTATNKRPDLVGRGPGIFLIIENKTWAPFTEHVDSEGTVQDQLGLYQLYLGKRREPFKGIVLLTHATQPPPHWSAPVCQWREVAQYLAHRHKPTAGSANEFASNVLLDFIKEQNMSGIRIELADIVAQPAYDRLHNAMSKLGAIGSRSLGEVLQSQKLNALAALQLRSSGGELAPPRYFGGLMTNDGAKATSSPFALWCGVLAKCAYQLEPQSEGLPELTVGLGIWRWEAALEPEEESLLSDFLCILSQSTAPSLWKYQVIDRDRNGPCILISTSCTLIALHQLAQGRDWDDLANDFYTRHVAALLEALVKPSGMKKMSFEKALREITRE
jgi:hypothetical protein